MTFVTSLRMRIGLTWYVMSNVAWPDLSDAPLRGLLVVDDHELIRLGLHALAQSQAVGIGQRLPVFDAATLEEALDLYGQHADAIALVLLDLNLPDAFGLAGLVRFRERFPAAHVVVLSGANDPQLKRQALQGGARAYLSKSADLKEVVAYLRALNLSGMHCGTGALPAVAQEGGTLADTDTDTATATATATHKSARENDPNDRMVRTATGQSLRLTGRQAQVLDWLLAGYSNREIAERTHLSEGTIKNHVSALLLCAGVRSRAQLISLLR